MDQQTEYEVQRKKRRGPVLLNKLRRKALQMSYRHLPPPQRYMTVRKRHTLAEWTGCCRVDGVLLFPMFTVAVIPGEANFPAIRGRASNVV